MRQDWCENGNLVCLPAFLSTGKTGVKKGRKKVTKKRVMEKKKKVAKKAKKQDQQKVDGLSKKDVAKIRSAIRQVWHRSHVRKLCVKRATGKGGFFYCEKCLKRVPKICIDHVVAVGEVDGGFIKRLFCSSKGLMALCKKCHDAKTREEREALAMKRLIG